MWSHNYNGVCKQTFMARALVTQFICMYANTVAVIRLHVFKKTMIESIKFQSKRLKFKHKCKIVCLNHAFSLLNPFVKKNPSGL